MSTIRRPDAWSATNAKSPSTHTFWALPGVSKAPRGQSAAGLRTSTTANPESSSATNRWAPANAADCGFFRLTLHSSAGDDGVDTSRTRNPLTRPSAR